MNMPIILTANLFYSVIIELNGIKLDYISSRNEFYRESSNPFTDEISDGLE